MLRTYMIVMYVRNYVCMPYVYSALQYQSMYDFHAKFDIFVGSEVNRVNLINSVTAMPKYRSILSNRIVRVK